jgi:hypothetical protein
MTKDSHMPVRDSVGREGLLVSVVLASVIGVVSLGGDCGAGASVGSEGATSVDAGHQPATRDAEVDTGAGNTIPVDTGSSTTAAFVASSSGTAMTGAAGGSGDGGKAASSAGVPVAEPDAATNAENSAGPTCYLDNEPCGDGGAPFCCNGNCINGACGGKLAEGEPCQYESGEPIAGTAPCLAGLACNSGKCGTNACSPDGTACGPDVADGGVVCCNDDCNGTICGGS